MGNPWFQFKQFNVEQAHAALKVGTDACILGAWTKQAAPVRILDIGTGTGLLTLMLAQRYKYAQLDALEPEQTAAAQARDNFLKSPWNDRIRLYQLPVQEFFPGYTYELIICNPPFYPRHLKSADSGRNMALHQETLTFAALARACSRLLTVDGLCYILLPPRQAAEFEAEAALQGLFVQQRLLVQDRPQLPVHRTITSFSTSSSPQIKEAQLRIRDADGAYSTAYRKLLQDYYIIF